MYYLLKVRNKLNKKGRKEVRDRGGREEGSEGREDGEGWREKGRVLGMETYNAEFLLIKPSIHINYCDIKSSLVAYYELEFF